MDAAFSLDPEERDLIRSLIVADPELVLGDDQVMRRLIGETGDNGRRVVDLRDRLLERLEQRLDRLVDTHRTVIAAAYQNVEGTRQLHGAVLALIEPVGLGEFLKCLVQDLPELMGIAEARLCLEADVTERQVAEGLGDDLGGRVLALPEGTVEMYLSFDGEPVKPVTLRAAGAESELIFGEANPVRSEALMKLDLGGATALMALGSADPGKFDPAHGTDLLDFFAGVIERLLVRHLSDAAQA